MTSRFIMPFADVGSGIKPSSGALLYFFEDDGVTPKDTYTTKAATVANANPVVSDSNGVFPAIYIKADYLVTLEDKNNSQIFGLSPINEFAAVTDAELVKNFNTLDSAIASPGLVDGDTVKLGDRGNSTWNVVLLSTVTVSVGAPAIGNVVAWGNNTGAGTDLALVLEINGVADFVEFGCIGDGVADDKAAMLLAFDHFGADGGTVHRPNGIYLTATDLTLSNLSNIKVTAESHKAIIKLAPDANLIIKSPTNVSWMDGKIEGTKHDTLHNNVWVTNYTNFKLINENASDFGGSSTNKTGSTMIYLYAGTVSNDNIAAGPSTGGRVIGGVFEGDARKTNFAVRVFTEFSPSQVGASNTDNIVTGGTYNEFNWNAVEIAGPNTSNVIISDCVANRCGLTPFDLDKGCHECIVHDVTINRLLGNIDTVANPNTAISAVAIQGIDPTTGYGRNNLIHDVTVNLLKDDIDTYDRRVSFAGMFYAENCLIHDIKGTCDAVPLRDPSQHFGLAAVSYETISNCEFRHVHAKNCSAGIHQVGSFNNAMTYSDINKFLHISNEGVMTSEIIRQDFGVGVSAKSQCLYDNLNFTSDLSDPVNSGFSPLAVCSFTGAGASTHFAIVQNSTLTTTHVSAWMFKAVIVKFGMNNLELSGIPQNDRLIYDDGGSTLTHIGIKDLTANFGQFAIDVNTIFNSVAAGVSIVPEITQGGLSRATPVTLYSTSASATAPVTSPNGGAAGNWSNNFVINKITKAAGGNIGWVRAGAVWREYGTIAI